MLRYLLRAGSSRDFLTRVVKVSGSTAFGSFSFPKMGKEYAVRKIGVPNTVDHKVYLEDGCGNVLSFFHDVPLYTQEKGVLNMVVEIPRWSNAKMEISKDIPLNPIHQDVKKGKVRFVRNVFPTTGYIWNYGALPQTWEDPMTDDVHTNIPGDNDPLDAIEIGSAKSSVGEIKKVKVLGGLALIDEGETDWKIIVIDVNDPLAGKVNCEKDIESVFPGLLQMTKEWFYKYKIPDGKPKNTIAFDGKVFSKEVALEIIDMCHKTWKGLVTGTIPPKGKDYDIDPTNLTVENSKYKIDKVSPTVTSIPEGSALEPAPIPSEVDVWYFI